MHNLPEDIRAEVLLDYLPEDSYRVSIRGLHKRNSCRDIQEVDTYTGKTVLGLTRKGLYDTLPEYLFHTFDRFDMMSGREMKDKFTEALAIQEKEKEIAHAFFAPVDLALLSLKREAFRKITDSNYGNKVLLNILCDRLSEEQKNNRFVQEALQFLRYAGIIRGDKTLFTLMLRKIFRKESLSVEQTEDIELYSDDSPRYQDTTGGVIGDVYAGNAYYESVKSYDLKYWPDGGCDGDFLLFLKEMEIFRCFMQDYFLSVEETLRFRIVNDEDIIVLNSEEIVNYLNYNTNL